MTKHAEFCIIGSIPRYPEGQRHEGTKEQEQSHSAPADVVVYCYIGDKQ